MLKPHHNQGSAVRSSAGFSLLELLIAMSVAVIALSIAVPSFTGIINSNRLSATANDLIGAINLARIQAIKRNTPTQFCSNDAFNNGSDTLGTACGTAAGAVKNLNPGGTTTTDIVDSPDIPATLTISTSSDMIALRFGGNGLATTPTGNVPYTGLVADVFSDKISENNHRCIYLATGSVISSCRITANSGGCPVNEPPNCTQ